MRLKVFALSLSLFVFTGCATLTSGMWDRVKLETTPSGAKVTDESGVLLTTTPGYITIKRRETPKLTFKKEGYEDVTVQLIRKANMKTLWSLLPLGLVAIVPADGGPEQFLALPVASFVIDYATGANWDHDESIHLEMVKSGNE